MGPSSWRHKIQTKADKKCQMKVETEWGLASEGNEVAVKDVSLPQK